MSIAIERVLADGAELEYFKYGTGHNVLVVFPGLSIKSIMLYKDAVADTLGLFGEEFEVYVFDRRKNLPQEYSTEDMARDYIRAFEILGLKDISVYGISQGGMIALTVAVMRSDLIKALVLGSTCSRLNDEAVNNLKKWHELSVDEDEDGLIDAFASKVYSKPFYEKYGEVIRASSKNITSDEFKRFAILTGKLNEYDIYGRLDEIKCPALIMAGSEDSLLNVGASYEIQVQMNCEIFVFEGYGHAVYDENEEFKIRANEFYKRVLRG